MLTPTQIDGLIQAVAQASKAVLEVYSRADHGTVIKGDGSPLTLADQASHGALVAALAKVTPNVPIISEEGTLPAQAPTEPYWLVDPLDGTKEFINRNGQFTVNIGLIANNAPLFGIVSAPTLERLWVGDRINSCAYAIDELGSRLPIAARTKPAEGITVVRSRSHMNASDRALIGEQKVADERPLGSSLKICLIAEGKADFYPRSGRTMEWDTAAAHAVVLAAGGHITRADVPQQALTYGKTDFANDCGFIAWGR